MIVNGGPGDDILTGSAGDDTMTGFAGNDRYYVNSAGDQVIEAPGGGTDTVHTTVSYTLAAGEEIESLRVYGVTAGLTLTGNEYGNFLLGGAGDDTLNGLGGNDRLDGGAGADVMTGGTGDDIYYVNDAGDRVIEATGGGTDTVHTTVSYTLAAGEEIESLRVYGVSSGLTLTGNEFGNYLLGGTGDDTLNGGGGNDRLNGGAGADTMAGGTGDDIYYVDDAGDRVVEAAGEGNDTVYATVSYTLAAGEEVEALRVYGTSAGLILRGNELDNFLLGGAGDDTLESGDGNDRLDGGAGNDTLSTTGASAVIQGGAGDDSIRLDGTSISTGSVDGGAGNDTVHSVDLGAFVIRNVETLDTYYGYLTGSIAQIASFQHYTAVLANDPGMQLSISLRGAGGSLDFTTGISGQNSVEIRDAGLTSAIAITGSVNGDRLNGTSFDDTLKGGAGADIMNGGDGDDTYYVDNAGDQVIDSAGTDTILASADYVLSAGVVIEYLKVDGSAGIHLTGNGFANDISGGAGDDTLTGGGGNDRLYGGAGDDHIVGGADADLIDGGTGADVMDGGNSQGDTFYVDNAGDRIVGSASSSTILATADWTADSDLLNATAYVIGSVGRHLTVGGSAIRLFGDIGDDTLTSGAGDDRLEGGIGIDVMAGGAGDDTYYVDNVGDQVIEAAGGGSDAVYTSVDYTLGAGQEIEYLYAYNSSGPLSLAGNELDNHIVGTVGSDTLNGGAGNDTILGGDDPSDPNDPQPGDTMYGGAGDDHIVGGNRSDVIDGGAGADIMDGGNSQHDTFYVDNAGDQILGQLYVSTIYTSVDYTVGGNLTDATVRVLGSTGLHLTGGSGVNTLIGGAGDDVLTGGWFVNELDGGAGADIMVGQADADYFHVDNAGDQVFDAPSDNIIGKFDTLYATVDYTLAAGQEIERLRVDTTTGIHLTGNEFAMLMFGNTGNDRLTGGIADDTLTGDAGDDRLEGGGGNDSLTGGDGVDTFVFDTPLGAGNIDTVVDFDASSETIELSHAVFAGFAAGTLTAAQFSSNGPTGTGAQVVYDAASGALSYRPENGAMVQFATVSNHATLSASDFVVA